MYAANANLRPAYTDNEISKLFHNKRMENGDTIDDLSKRFCAPKEIIKNIDKYKYDFSMDMIKIASKYLSIPISSLTEILEDDRNNLSCRGCDDKNARVLIDIVNVIFNEMIMQKKLSV